MYMKRKTETLSRHMIKRVLPYIFFFAHLFTRYIFLSYNRKLISFKGGSIMARIVLLIKGIISKSKGPSEYVKFYNAHMGDLDLEH